MTGRELLDDLGAALGKARSIRYLGPDKFADVDVEDLASAARALRAISYSTLEGAKNLDRVVNHRVQPEGPPE